MRKIEKNMRTYRDLLSSLERLKEGLFISIANKCSGGWLSFSKSSIPMGSTKASRAVPIRDDVIRLIEVDSLPIDGINLFVPFTNFSFFGGKHWKLQELI